MKYQWFKVEWDIGYEELKSLLLSFLYTEKKGRGFVLDEAYQKNIITGRYIDKKIVKKETSPPYGQPLTYEEVIYSIFKFQINLNNQPSLLLINPPRAWTLLSSALSVATNHRVVFYNQTIDLKNIIKQLKIRLSHFSIISIHAKQIPFSRGATAAIVIKGKGDLLQKLESVTGADKGLITKFEFSFMTEHGTHKALISNRIRLEVTDQYIEEELFNKVYDIFSKLL